MLEVGVRKTRTTKRKLYDEVAPVENTREPNQRDAIIAGCETDRPRVLQCVSRLSDVYSAGSNAAAFMARILLHCPAQLERCHVNVRYHLIHATRHFCRRPGEYLSCYLQFARAPPSWRRTICSSRDTLDESRCDAFLRHCHTYFLSLSLFLSLYVSALCVCSLSRRDKKHFAHMFGITK